MEDDNLPTLWEGDSPVQAYDIGDVDFDPNPRAEDLGYSTGTLAVASNFRGDKVMYANTDGDARIECDRDTFIEDLADWN